MLKATHKMQKEEWSFSCGGHTHFEMEPGGGKVKTSFGLKGGPFFPWLKIDFDW